jgi:hypothetical protein
MTLVKDRHIAGWTKYSRTNGRPSRPLSAEAIVTPSNLLLFLGLLRSIQQVAVEHLVGVTIAQGLIGPGLRDWK